MQGLLKSYFTEDILTRQDIAYISNSQPWLHLELLKNTSAEVPYTNILIYLICVCMETF